MSAGADAYAVDSSLLEEAERHEETARKAELLRTLNQRGKLVCNLFRGHFKTGLYWIDLSRKNNIGILTHFECASGTDFLKALEALKLKTEKWEPL